MATNAIRVVEEDDQIQTDIDFDDSEFETVITKEQKRQYKLMHRRFEHCGLNILRKFYKVILIKEPIKIPLPRCRVCSTCKLVKMKNLIKKKLAVLKRIKLKLMYIDIAKSFIKML